MTKRVLALARAGCACLTLAATPVWATNSVQPATVPSPTGGEPCFAGDERCRDDAFGMAALLLEAENVHYLVTGRIALAAGLPDKLGSTADVYAQLRLTGVRKPPVQCPQPPSIQSRTYCAQTEALPPRLTVRIPSDWFVWPATGTSRLVARRAGRHLADLRELERQHAAGRVGEREHAAAKARLEGRVQDELDANAPRTAPGTIRLLEDRRAHLAVGGEYLFALGEAVEGDAGTYHVPLTPEVDGGDWRVFWGDEMRELDIALMLIGNCMVQNPPLFVTEPGPHHCMLFARGQSKLRYSFPKLLRIH